MQYIRLGIFFSFLANQSQKYDDKVEDDILDGKYFGVDPYLLTPEYNSYSLLFQINVYHFISYTNARALTKLTKECLTCFFLLNLSDFFRNIPLKFSCATLTSLKHKS